VPIAAMNEPSIDPFWSMRRNSTEQRMQPLQIICQVIIGLGIINVWLFRSNRKTLYRGCNASNLKEEFAAYGLPPLAIWVVGVIKVGAAIALLVGVFVPSIVQPAAIVVALMMVGALAMHAKVKDSMQRFIPAAIMLLLSLAVALLANS
jgi:uncharacterized membrane protein YphA (DoxX/SURF4 family)